jgi:endoglucanase
VSRRKKFFGSFFQKRTAFYFFYLLTTSAQAASLLGVNLSGAELGGDKLPGREGTDYIYPDAASLAYFHARGMTAVRLPVLWERLQPHLGGPLSDTELGHVDRFVEQARGAHLRVVLDLHNYGRFQGQLVGSDAVPRSAFAALWGAVARHYRGERGGSEVVFGLMNEPHDIDAVAWAADEQAALDAIRQSGAANLVLVSGVDWDGAHNFVSGAGYGSSNAEALGRLNDPAGNYAIEMHQYLDPDYSGTHAGCMDASAARETLLPATAWLRATHNKGFLGEFAASRTPQCEAALNALLDVIDENRDVWIGWTYWAAGPWWGDYMFSVQPKDGHDAPQITVLERHVGAAP